MKVMKVLKIVLIAGLLLTFLYAENNVIVVHNIEVSSNKLPETFNGFIIVQLSDLQGKIFGKDNSSLVSKVKSVKPDIIVITGDLTDSSFYNEDSIKGLAKSLSQIAPVYYVTGNHEVYSSYLDELIYTLEKCSVHYLNNSSELISRNGQSILLAGVEDPGSTEKPENSSNEKILSDEIKQALGSNAANEFTILLSHRPEQFSLYIKSNIDLVFSGHAHGGQIRLPFIGGLYAPNQGYFPKYTTGKYSKDNTTMIVSRGLGNGSFPQRLFNQPEITVIRLTKDKQ